MRYLGILCSILSVSTMLVLATYYDIDWRGGRSTPACPTSQLEEVRTNYNGKPRVIWHGVIQPKTITGLPIYTIIVDAGEDSWLMVEKVYAVWRSVRDDVRPPSQGIGQWEGKRIIALPCELVPNYREEAEVLRGYHTLFGKIKVTVTM